MGALGFGFGKILLTHAPVVERGIVCIYNLVLELVASKTISTSNLLFNTSFEIYLNIGLFIQTLLVPFVIFTQPVLAILSSAYLCIRGLYLFA